MNLADPELELIDPTPNVHNLFVHFDELFFWSKLVSRALVKWSKRMYSCAGVCSYEGHGGLCNISLSEPLLKLRPRKDLVETLLHEMIHAFLFITNGDNNRDGHGPNFQAHMHRINRAAGLNISIYHDFHDEVKEYQKHWWRCDGRCQMMKPYFGIVRRPINRAPGPSDFWWKTHQRLCGGTFVKIKEPEKPEKTHKPKKSDKNKGKIKADITKFINNNNNDVVNKNDNKGNNKENKVTTNINAMSHPKTPEFNNVVDLGRKRTNSASVIETVRDVWIKKQIPTVPSTNSQPPVKSLKKSKSSSVHVDSPPKKIMKIDDYFKTKASSILKDVYGEEFMITQSNNSSKLKAVIVSNSAKVPPVNVFVDCPSCNAKVYSNDINKHLDECLNRHIIKEFSQDQVKSAAVIKTNIVKSEDCGDVLAYPDFKPKPEIKFENDDKTKLKFFAGDLQTIPPFRFKDENHPKIDTFKSTKLEAVVKQENKKRPTATSPFFEESNPCTSKEYPAQKCPGCGIIVDVPMKQHLDECLGFFDNNTTIPEEGISDLDTVVIDDEFNPLQIKSEPGTSKEIKQIVDKCPCCANKVDKPIEEHLEECLGFFDNNTTVPIEGATVETIVIDDDDDDIFDESQTLNATGTKSPCPCCYKMIEIADMNEHLDVCLSTSLNI